MVNPLWLEKAYIIENKATDYEKEEDVDSFATKKTNVQAIRYKTFVGSYPTKTTYFQPILDALEVVFSPLVRSSQALIVEGKNDFHPFVYFRQRLTAAKLPEIFPSNGAGSSSCLISLFRGWGVNFRILLDDDRAGKQGKKKYMEEFLLNGDEVVTLGEISSELKGKEFEDIFQMDVKDAVAKAYSVKKPTKKQYSLYFQELLAIKSGIGYSQTEKVFKPISEWLDQQFHDKK